MKCKSIARAFTAFLLLASAVRAASGSASVLDIFPSTGVSSLPGKASCSFDYAPCGSKWHPGVDESQVFLASVRSKDWQLGIGKGGQVYSLRGPYGESVAPQRPPSPWNDEVWQIVVTDESLIGPVQNYQNAMPPERRAEVWNATFPFMYFVHQAGIYTKGAGLDASTAPAPFYSPCLRKRWNSDTRTLELVNWMQQARTPCAWKSGVLTYSAYRDVGDGILEVNNVVCNFGPEVLSFQNIPWGGVRHSSLPNIVMSSADGSWKAAPGVYGWTDIPTRNLVDSGGWMAWTQSPTNDASPTLALVFGADEDNMSNGKRVDEAIRWGKAGTGEAARIRDYSVAERMSHAPIRKGTSWSVRWYLVSGDFGKVRQAAARLVEKAGISRLKFSSVPRQDAWVKGGRINTAGEGAPWASFMAFPVKDTVPVFLLEDKRTGKQVVTADPYALAETEPFPNPFPKTFKDYKIYNDRVIYKQYAPHIGYKNLLGYAYAMKPAAGAARIQPPKGIRLHASANELWVVE
jgi:hypothetical protein